MCLPNTWLAWFSCGEEAVDSTVSNEPSNSSIIKIDTHKWRRIYLLAYAEYSVWFRILNHLNWFTCTAVTAAFQFASPNCSSEQPAGLRCVEVQCVELRCAILRYATLRCALLRCILSVRIQTATMQMIGRSFARRQCSKRSNRKKKLIHEPELRFLLLDQNCLRACRPQRVRMNGLVWLRTLRILSCGLLSYGLLHMASYSYGLTFRGLHSFERLLPLALFLIGTSKIVRFLPGATYVWLAGFLQILEHTIGGRFLCKVPTQWVLLICFVHLLPVLMGLVHLSCSFALFTSFTYLVHSLQPVIRFSSEFNLSLLSLLAGFSLISN